MEANQIELTRKSTGRTTRLLDNLIQKFFSLEKEEYILVLDHEPNANAHRELLEKFRKRMELEHPHVQYEIVNYDRCIKKL